MNTNKSETVAISTQIPDFFERPIKSEKDAGRVRARLVKMFGEASVRSNELAIARRSTDPEIIEKVIEQSQAKRVARQQRVADRMARGKGET